VLRLNQIVLDLDARSRSRADDGDLFLGFQVLLVNALTGDVLVSATKWPYRRLSQDFLPVSKQLEGGHPELAPIAQSANGDELSFFYQALP
jgi:hypothetical protein